MGQWYLTAPGASDEGLSVLVVGVRLEVVLGAAAATQELPVRQLLDVVETEADAPVPSDASPL